MVILQGDVSEHGVTPQPPATTEGGRAFLQERLSLFGRWFFVVALAYYVFANVPTDPIMGFRFDWATEYFGAHERLNLAIVACAAIVWLATRDPPRAARTLVLLDAFGTIVPLVLLAITAVVNPHPQVADVFSGLAPPANTVVVRPFAAST